MSLREYKRKRDFRRTPEPQGDGPPAPGRLFVIQKHAARRLHYDFRLELDGTLKSWAVPKGPSLNPATKALAVHVEDHPLDYADFEGVIPKGQYGGGTVMVWDHGTWEPEGDASKQYRAGKLKFQLHGDKLHGAWSLVQMSGAAGEGGKNWLLIKSQDKAARKKTDILTEKPKSVLSGRELDQIAADADRVWTSNGAATSDTAGQGGARASKSAGKQGAATRAAKSIRSKPVAVVAPKSLVKLEGARRAPQPDAFKPQLATLAAEVPAGENWLHELKFDGYRLLAFFDRGDVRLVTRNGNDWTKRFLTIARALSRLPIKRGILDGEVVSLNEQGRSDFQELQNLLKRGNDDALVYYLFDAPFLEGYDLTRTPLEKRKQQLSQVLLSVGPQNDGTLRYSDHIRGQGRDVLAHACRYAMEGVVSKRAESGYDQFRSPSWLKVKCLKRQEFVIGGYTKPSGSRVGFGALLLGYYKDGELQYAGRVGTGFARDSLRQIYQELKKRQTPDTPFQNPPRGSQARDVTWVRPELVGEVEFTEWTDDARLRHPSFQGLREDKPAAEIVREVATPPSKLQKPAAESKVSMNSNNRNGHAEVARVRITHPDRILYPEQGLTKLELAEFYESIADWILPHVINRPLTLVRCPQGRTGQCFYQKHLTDSLPQALRGVSVKEKDGRAQYVYFDDLTGLISVVQMGALELHPWPARIDQLEKPDRVVFDLDPGPGVLWKDVIAAARDVRRRIEDYGLESFVRTSGGKGLHVVVPLNPGSTWAALKSFAKAIATQMAQDDPENYVATASKAKRNGKIFIDYLRNSRGATSVASYSTRARLGAPVAMPLRWSELGKVEAANQYTVANTVRRLSALGSDPWANFFKLRQTLKSSKTSP